MIVPAGEEADGRARIGRGLDCIYIFWLILGLGYCKQRLPKLEPVGSVREQGCADVELKQLKRKREVGNKKKPLKR